MLIVLKLIHPSNLNLGWIDFLLPLITILKKYESTYTGLPTS